MAKQRKKPDKLHWPCAVITLGFLACSVFVFRSSFWRVLDAGRDFGVSVAYYLTRLFGFEVIAPTVNEIPESMSELWTDVLPVDWDIFKLKAKLFWVSLWNGETFPAYAGGIGSTLSLIAKFIMLAGVPLAILLVVMVRRALKRENTDHGKESRPLQLFKRTAPKIARPVKDVFFRSLDFLREHSLWWKLWLAIWVYNLNLGAIVLGFLAYYFYFAVSFDFVHFYLQIYKLAADLTVILGVVPWWCWLIGAWVLICRWRKKKGLRKLRAFEGRNRAFLNVCAIAVMIVGTMGKKKTTLMTDLALTQQAMFRDLAYETMLEQDVKFPNFPWIAFETEIRGAVERHEVYSFAYCREYVRTLRIRFETAETDEERKAVLYGYDFERYGLFFNDELKVDSLFDILEGYAELYFLYTLPNSLIVSNYAIRDDAVLMDKGNFPMWDSDFFERDPWSEEEISRHSKILDFDILRLGKKVDPTNPKAGSWEFGVIAITEIGKERGNQLDHQALKRDSPEANQKNDLFNVNTKMVRHPGTVFYIPFVRQLVDEQRVSSLGADAKDLHDIIYIVESGEERLAMPFFGLEDFLHDLIYPRFVDIYSQFRFRRGDNTLTMYLWKALAAAVHRHYVRVHNQFGYCEMHLQKEAGTQDGVREDYVYRIMNKKIYARRFATDCFAEVFAEQTRKSPVGLGDYSEYETERATFEELKAQHSYFVRDLEQIKNAEQVSTPKKGEDIK